MKPIKNVFTIPSAAVFLVATALTAIGCGSGDVDPDKVKVDSPGYYNGPMNKKGASGASEQKGAAATTTGTGE